jgi:DMSO/TMAO reductase YedYZ molybdopterin-dependent catalytic subunit
VKTYAFKNDCADEHGTPVPLEDAMTEDSMIAFKMNGEPIPFDQGFPASPLFLTCTPWKSPKWLTKTEFMEDYEDGYWEGRGYHERGNVSNEERFKEHERKLEPL